MKRKRLETKEKKIASIKTKIKIFARKKLLL